MRKLLVILLLLPVVVHAQVNIITTIAGTGTAGYSGDGGAATTAELNRPHSICFDGDNNILICDAFNHAIRKLNMSTNVITNVCGNGIGAFSGDGGLAADAQLLVPEGICTDAAGNIFIADGLNKRVRKIQNGTHITSTIVGDGTAGMGGDGGFAVSAQIGQPVGIIVGGSFLYISDYDNNKIRRVNLVTGIITTFAGNGIAGYSGDGGPAINAQLDGGIDVICDAVGNIFISDQWNSVVRKVNITTGIITTVVGKGTSGYSGDNGPATNAELNEPGGLFIDKNNNLFISDYRNGAIRKVNQVTGIITTVAGGSPGYGGDGGPATDAKLKCTDVWVDDNENIYIADYVTQRIRKVSSGVAVNGIDKDVESRLYPNPTKGIFAIQTPINISLVSIYNIAGMLVYERTCTMPETEIDITSQPPGMYMVYVQCGEKKYVSKVTLLR